MWYNQNATKRRTMQLREIRAYKSTEHAIWLGIKVKRDNWRNKYYLNGQSS